MSPGRLMVKPEVCHLRTSNAMASYKGLVKLDYCTWAGAHRVGRTRDGHTTCQN